MDLIFFGIQGSGKGTLGKVVAERYNMQVFEMGGQLRKLAQEDSELGRKVKSIIEAGKLVSNEVVMEILENFIVHLSAETNVVFDGIPRQIDQAKGLNALLEKHGRKYRAVLMDISEETALYRLTHRRMCEKCKTIYPSDYTKDTCEKCEGKLITRSDDVPDAIKVRLDAFQKETVPVMALYQNMIKIDGEHGIEEVRENAFQLLDPIMKA